MSKNKLLATLKANCLMPTSAEIRAFENALTELAQNHNEQDLPELHLILDDRCQNPEVMFGLIHVMESFDIKQQIEAFISVVPQLMITASNWTSIIHQRILNDQEACQLYQQTLHSVNLHKPHFLYHLLEQSATMHLQSTTNYLETTK